MMLRCFLSCYWYSGVDWDSTIRNVSCHWLLLVDSPSRGHFSSQRLVQRLYMGLVYNGSNWWHCLLMLRMQLLLLLVI